MASEDLTATALGVKATAGKGEGGSLKTVFKTVEVSASASAGSTYDFGKIPSNARISGRSQLYWDDLTTANSPTLDMGLSPVNGNITADDDALNDGLDVSAAGTGSALLKNLDRVGQPAWDLVNGQTSDPGGELTVLGTLKDTDLTSGGGGTVVLELAYTLD